MSSVFPPLTSSQSATVALLFSLDQGHLFSEWPVHVDGDPVACSKLDFLDSITAAHVRYPGGLEAYVANAKKLLDMAKNNVNSFDGCWPEVPEGERLDTTSELFLERERQGAEAMDGVCFVLVAGGMGERLGYDGIKIELTAELVTGKCFFAKYAEHILAFQERARVRTGNNDLILPLAIMTSGDTHAKTVDLLQRHNNFGLAKDQIVIIKQELVPALKDCNAHFVADNYRLVLKPHGHGDVHTLLHQSGLVKKWTSEGRKWVIFFQDTNGIVFHSLPAALGVSIANRFEVNSLAVPRRAGEAVGGICTLRQKDGSKLTINVEYNQLAPLLKATVNPLGDVPDETGFSPYPGNMNVLIFDLPSYHATLEKSGGAVPEFVNPKFRNPERTEFTPTRLECMMQDYPRLLGSDARVGFTQLDRWISFSAVKNNIADAKKKQVDTGVAECAASGEWDIYYLFRKKLSLAGVDLEVEGADIKFNGIAVKSGAAVVISPFFAPTLYELIERLKDSKISISPNSLVNLSSRVEIKELHVDGAVTIESTGVIDLKEPVSNGGPLWKQVDPADASVDQKIRIRGYLLEIPEKKTI